jgi:hypothetical protein
MIAAKRGRHAAFYALLHAGEGLSRRYFRRHPFTHFYASLTLFYTPDADNLG